MGRTADFDAYYNRERPTPDADALCLTRGCYRPGEDKGTFSQGRGYTSYREWALPVCMTRMCHGCPPGPVDPVTRYGRRPAPDGGWVAGLAALRARLEGPASPARREGLKLMRDAHRLLVDYLPSAARREWSDRLRAALFAVEVARGRRPERLADLASVHEELAQVLSGWEGEE